MSLVSLKKIRTSKNQFFKNTNKDQKQNFKNSAILKEHQKYEILTIGSDKICKTCTVKTTNYCLGNLKRPKQSYIMFRNYETTLRD